MVCLDATESLEPVCKCLLATIARQDIRSFSFPKMLLLFYLGENYPSRTYILREVECLHSVVQYVQRLPDYLLPLLRFHPSQERGLELVLALFQLGAHELHDRALARYGLER